MAINKFSTSAAIERNNGKQSSSGINWSYAEFTTQRDMALFIVECNNNGYRTRNEYTQDGKFYVQFHHYED